MEKSRRRIRRRIHSLILVILTAALGALIVIQSIKKHDQDNQARKCVYNQTIPVQEYGSFDIVCVAKGTPVDEERKYPFGDPPPP